MMKIAVLMFAAFAAVPAAADQSICQKEGYSGCEDLDISYSKKFLPMIAEGSGYRFRTEYNEEDGSCARVYRTNRSEEVTGVDPLPESACRHIKFAKALSTKAGGCKTKLSFSSKGALKSDCSCVSGSRGGVVNYYYFERQLPAEDCQDLYTPEQWNAVLQLRENN